MIENPLNTLFFCTGAMREALYASGAEKISTFLGAFGNDIAKPTVLWGTVAFLDQLKRKKPQGKNHGDAWYH